MSKKKYSIDEWKKWEEELLSAGISRYRAHTLMGERLGLSRMTIYRYLTPGQNISSF